MQSIIFHPYEMESLRNKHPLEWANDFLYSHIVKYVQDNKHAVLDTLRKHKEATLFRFQAVNWNHSLAEEKRLLRKMTFEEKQIYLQRKKYLTDEIEENGYSHKLWRPDSTTTISAVLEHTDLSTRLNVAFGTDFDVIWTTQLADDSPRIDFDNPEPQYIVLNCTIGIRYDPSRYHVGLKCMRRCKNKYKNHFPSVENVYILDKPVRRHLKFDDD